MNTPVRRIAMAVMAMIVLLLGNLTYVQVVKAGEYRTDPRNKRVLLAEYSRQRGQISAGDQIVASSTETNDRLRYQRQYPKGPVYAAITGYYSPNHGSSGLEAAAEEILNGSDDRLFARRLSDLVTGRDPQGASIALTVDPDVQQVAYDQLASKGYRGAVVALEPSTGAILAMVSTPSYDPSQLATHDASKESAAWAELTSARPPVLNNRAISERYPPGSTFKLIDVAAALSSGRYTPDSQLTAASTIRLANGRTTMENYNGNPCGTGATATMRDALARSCNTAFAQLAAELGIDAIKKQAEAFGIGTQKIQLPMTVADSTLGQIADVTQLQQSSIGQLNVALTPLQNAMIVAAIANGGRLMKPYLIKQITALDLTPVETAEPDMLGQAISPSVAATLTQMMVNNEDSYSGSGKIAGVKIAAKTGTAELGSKTQAPHVWYVAFAPAENPQVAVAVVVENGGDGNDLAATGGKVAAPIGRAVIKKALEKAGAG
ncbi:peptidoglycan glycosyltransferase [Pseudonocardia thermophila]|uniref:Peptidoglycan glycosyltransferase n=1 Tax=Pseudonocardia thermophila TaxID=1848 RepID=A0A1M6VDA8_PSETH|nr:penicillin-binding protein 2 [Pseudonocardia thermophila]SHK79354.1 peptidoglycan glycosyltransferase [Pseudonocardia thermophila]